MSADVTEDTKMAEELGRSGEQEPKPSLEEQVLRKLKYSDDQLDMEVVLPTGETVTGRNFLAAYKDAGKREYTELILRGFLSMNDEHPRYEEMQAYVARYITPFFGEPNPN